MIYLLFGEPFQVERSYRKLREKLLPVSLQGMGLSLFQGNDLRASELFEAHQSLPMLASTRLIVVSDADKIPKLELEKLESHLDSLLDGSEILFLASKIDKRQRFWKTLLEKGKIQEFRPLYPREVPAWVQEEVRSRGKKIGQEAVRWLVERLGADLGLIHSALEKVLFFVGKNPEITVADLEGTVHSGSFRSVFELTDAIGDKKKERAISLFHQMTQTGESPVGLLALIARHFRILFKVKETGEGAPPYFLKNYQRQAAGFSDLKLKDAVDQIFETDWNLKRSPLSQKLLMEGLILKLCS